MKNISKLVAAGLVAVGLMGQGSVALAAGKHGHHDHDHASALGKPGDAAKVSRTVEITMNDTMRFNPASVSVKRNETIRFV